MIVYANFSVSLHGLNLKNDAEMEALRVKVEAAVRSVHPAARFDGDVEVEVEWVEYSGLKEESDHGSNL